MKAVSMIIFAGPRIVDDFLQQLRKKCPWTYETSELHRFLFSSVLNDELFTRVKFSLVNELSEMELSLILREDFPEMENVFFFDSERKSKEEVDAAFAVLRGMVSRHAGYERADNVVSFTLQ